MKITDTDFATLETAIKPLDTESLRTKYRAGLFSNSKHCKDVNMRYRWDLLHACGLKIGDGKGIKGLPLYAYLSDDNIDTALRRIIKPL